MPLDMQQTRLADLASWSGITPIPNEVLEAHKLAEVAKHPGSWWYQHPILAATFFPFTALVSIMGGISCSFTMFICLLHDRLASALLWGTGASACLIVGVIVVSMGIFSRDGRKVYGPAEWQEHTYREVPIFVPRSIRQMAVEIMGYTYRNRNGNDLSIVYGKLVQNHITIDPYLVIRRQDDQIVLGIWDDDRIIHQATLTE